MAKSDTRHKIIVAANSLMLARSYTATSVDDICVQAGVSKGSFYHFFPTKEDLGLTLLDAIYQAGVDRIRDGDYVRIADPVQRMSGFFDHLEAIAPELWDHGCLMGNFATELGESNPAIAKQVDRLFTKLAGAMVPIFAPVLGSTDEALALAEQLLAVIEGGIIMARAHGDLNRIATGIRHFRAPLEAGVSARVGGTA